MHQPVRRVAHADVTLEFESRQPALCLADPIDRQAPLCQRQLGVAEQRASGQRGLPMAGVTLVQGAAIANDDAVLPAIATRAGEAIRPARASHCVGARRFGAEALQELGQRHALLELDLVVSHSSHCIVMGVPSTGWIPHWVS